MSTSYKLPVDSSAASSGGTELNIIILFLCFKLAPSKHAWLEDL